jgi:hypothetical protein
VSVHGLHRRRARGEKVRAPVLPHFLLQQR